MSAQTFGVEVLLFAKAREVCGGKPALVIQVPSHVCTTGISHAHIVGLISDHCPELKSLLSECVLALNEEYIEADENIKLTQRDVLAIIPPISGG